MKDLWNGWEKLKEKVSLKKKKLVFLDFDGTLVSIAESPDAVKLEPKTRAILETLCADRRTQLVIVSGRPLKELRRFLRLKNAILVGNHGLEIQGKGVALPRNAKKARKLRHLISLMTIKFKRVFASFPGAWVEDKRYTISVHFRKLERGQYVVFDELIRFFMKEYGRYPITWVRGKKVIEIRPSIYWGKGDTVTHLIKRFPGAVPVAIGDDRMDEDMFKALKGRGISVRVGYSRSSAAEYYLSSPNDVKLFLQQLC